MKENARNLNSSDFTYTAGSPTIPVSVSKRPGSAAGLRSWSYTVTFPDESDTILTQDKEWMTVTLASSRGEREERTIRFHDYHRIFEIAGLYEYVFHDKLKCCSPEVVAEMLRDVVKRPSTPIATPLRVLDIGAGNGLVADEVSRRVPVEKIVGIDILTEAAQAAWRDRPRLYNEYLIADLTRLSEQQRRNLKHYDFNCLTCVAALGFGDISVEAFRSAFNLISPGGAIAFNIKDAFLHPTKDQTGFSRFISKMLDDGALELLSQRHYRHRLSISGEELFYVGMIGKKIRDAS